MEYAIVHEDRDNSFTVTLKKNSVALTQTEMEAITKFEIKYNGTYYNSVDNSDGFEIVNATAKVTVKPYELGLESGDTDTVEFIVYDNGDYTNGLLWDRFKLKVSDYATVA